MENCKLCKINPADQTGSHILSWFLIRDAINKKERRRRHNEISFEISSENFVSTYFGNEILPDDIKQIKGRELTDEEIENQQNPYVRDNILCSNCESRLATLESIVSSNIIGKIRTHRVSEKSKYDTLSISNKEYFRLFIYSLAWRSSITQFNNFILENKEEELLRQLLDKNLDVAEDKLETQVNKNITEIHSIPLAVSFLETTEENTNSIYFQLTKPPYSMIINDLVFQLFFREKDTKRIPEYLFGVNHLVPRKKMTNLNEAQFEVAVINNELRKDIYSKLYSLVADKMMRSAVSKFRIVFRKIFNRQAPTGVVNYFKYKLSFTSYDKIQLYSTAHFINVAAEVMKEYLQVNAHHYIQPVNQRTSIWDI